MTVETTQHSVTMRDQKHLIWTLCAVPSTYYMTNKNFKFKFGKERGHNKSTISYKSQLKGLVVSDALTGAAETGGLL